MRFIIFIKQLFCKHKFIADTQIRVMTCEKCYKTYWYENATSYEQAEELAKHWKNL